MKKLLCLIMLMFICSCATVSVEEQQQRMPILNWAYHILMRTMLNRHSLSFQKAYELNLRDKEVLNAIGIIYLLKF